MPPEFCRFPDAYFANHIMTFESQPFEIICFGDSLTLGFQSPTVSQPNVESIPYGMYLQEWLGDRGRVNVRGVCGETTHDMRLRFHEDVLVPHPHVVVILGGTNDLGWGIAPSEIMENLSFFYFQAKAAGIMPIAVTVPSIGGMEEREEWDWAENSVEPTSAISTALALRLTLNQAIQEIGTQHQFPVVDLFVETCDPETKVLASRYSNDGLHLTTTGYQKLAALLWNEVIGDLL